MLKINRIAAISCLSLFATQCLALTADVFANQKAPVTVNTSDNSLQVNYYDVGEMETILSEINQQLKNRSQPESLQIAKALLREKKKHLNHAMDGIALINRYEIDRLPTIVFNHGQAVIYGETDLDKAVEEYRLWQKS